MSKNQCAVVLSEIECSSKDENSNTTSEYKELEEKCEKVLKRIKGRKAKGKGAKKSRK